MTLRRAVAVPFLRRDTEEVTRAEFVYTLSSDTGWFEPDKAEEVARRGIEEGLLTEDDGSIRVLFSLDGLEEPDGRPEVSRSEGLDAFERALKELVSSGYERREAVALINKRHARMGNASIEAAAVMTLKSEGIEVSSLAEEALESL